MVQRYTENTQQLDRPAGGAIQSQDFSAGAQAIAKGVESFGQDLGGAAKNLDVIAAARDEAKVRQFDAEDAPQLARIRATALTSQGLDAETATAEGIKQMQELRRAREKQLTSSRQREMYGRIFSERYASMVGDFTTHSIKQVVAANVAAAGARADSSAETAVLVRDNPEEFNRNIATGIQEVAHSMPGQPAEVVRQAQKKYVSGIHSGVVQQLLAQPEGAGVMDAQKWINDHVNSLTPEDEYKLRRLVNPVVEEQQIDADVGKVLSGAVGRDAAPEPSPARNPDLPPAGGPAPSNERAKVFSEDPAVAVLRGKGRITNTAAQHKARGSQNAIDIAAAPGTPIHPPMSGKVLKNWWSPEGGWSVLIQHPNGYVTGYAHMRSQSALDVGQEVSADTTIGGVGNTGARSHGNHVHFTVRQAPGGPKVDPQVVGWNSVDVPHTVAPTSVSWKEKGIQPYRADDGSGLGKALDDAHRLAVSQNWSPTHYEKVVAGIRQHFAVNEQLFNSAQRRNLDAASEALASADLAGKPLTERSQIPNYGALDAGGRASVDARLAANKKALLNPDGGEGGVKANGTTYADLAVGAIEQPEVFANVNIDLIPDITPGERTRLKVQQANIRKDMGQGKPAHNTQGTTILAAINRYAGIGGNMGFKTQQMTDKDKQMRGRLLDAVQAEVRRREAGGAKLTDDDVMAIVKQQTIPIIRRREGFFGTHDTSLPYYQAHTTERKAGERDVVQVPRAERDRIIAAWQRAYGGAMPSEPQIASLYLQRQGQ